MTPKEQQDGAIFGGVVVVDWTPLHFLKQVYDASVWEDATDREPVWWEAGTGTRWFEHVVRRRRREALGISDRSERTRLLAEAVGRFHAEGFG